MTRSSVIGKWEIRGLKLQNREQSMGVETFGRTYIQNLSLSGIIKRGSSFLWHPPKMGIQPLKTLPGYSPISLLKSFAGGPPTGFPRGKMTFSAGGPVLSWSGNPLLEFPFSTRPNLSLAKK